MGLHPDGRDQPQQEAVRRQARAPGADARDRPPRGLQGAVEDRDRESGGRGAGARHAVRHAAGRARQGRRLLARHREVARRGAAPAEGGGRARGLHVHLLEPRHPDAVRAARRLADRQLAQGRPQREAGGDRGRQLLRHHPQGRLPGAHGLPVRLHRRARPRHVQVPVDRPQPGQLRVLQGSGARRALRQAEPRDQSGGAEAPHPRVREAPAGRRGPLPDDPAVAPDHPALVEGQGLDGHAEPLPEQHARHGLARPAGH